MGQLKDKVTRWRFVKDHSCLLPKDPRVEEFVKANRHGNEGVVKAVGPTADIKAHHLNSALNSALPISQRCKSLLESTTLGSLEIRKAN